MGRPKSGNPPKTVQTKIRRTLKAFYKSHTFVIAEPKFFMGWMEVYIDYEKHYVSFCPADKNRCNVDLIRVWNSEDSKKRNEHILFETGEQFIIPELTAEERAARDKIYREFFSGIYNIVHGRDHEDY